MFPRRPKSTDKLSRRRHKSQVLDVEDNMGTVQTEYEVNTQVKFYNINVHL